MHTLFAVIGGLIIGAWLMRMYDTTAYRAGMQKAMDEGKLFLQNREGQWLPSNPLRLEKK